MKLLFPNPHAVYLHDTPARDLFEQTHRAFSSGCIRVERPLELAERVLADPKWNAEAIARVVESGKTRAVALRHPLPVLLLYWTAFPVAGPGGVAFAKDIYDRDARVLRGARCAGQERDTRRAGERALGSRFPRAVSLLGVLEFLAAPTRRGRFLDRTPRISHMTPSTTDFRDLLERVLPLDRLQDVSALAARQALRTGLARELESAGLMLLERFAPESRGRRAEGSRNRETPAAPTPLELPGPTERDGILLYPRAALPSRAPADLAQVRRLLHMEDLALLSDPRSSQAREALYGHLAQAGHELIGAGALRLFPLPEHETEQAAKPLAPDLATEALVRPSLLFYCPDLERSRRLVQRGRGGGARALALTAVLAGDRTPIGLLEVITAEPAPFRPEDLARIALFADFCGTVLERAARLEKLVFVDSMTSVYNRAYFELQARNEVARAMREQASVALCIADIDDFKAVNTAYGYEAGNAVLTQVANALKRGVRPFDTVARWGVRSSPCCSRRRSRPTTRARCASACARRSSVSRFPWRRWTASSTRCGSRSAWAWRSSRARRPSAGPVAGGQSGAARGQAAAQEPSGLLPPRRLIGAQALGPEVVDPGRRREISVGRGHGQIAPRRPVSRLVAHANAERVRRVRRQTRDRHALGRARSRRDR